MKQADKIKCEKTNRDLPMKKDITNLYCFIDDFTKECEKEIKKHAIKSGFKNEPTRIPRLSQAENINLCLLNLLFQILTSYLIHNSGSQYLT